MKTFIGKTLRWEWREGVIELTLDHEPANEIGTAMLADLEKFVALFESLARPPRKSRSSTPAPAPPPRNSSSPFRTRSFAVR